MLDMRRRVSPLPGLATLVAPFPTAYAGDYRSIAAPAALADGFENFYYSEVPEVCRTI
ncbi:MAG: hypothetical protein QOK48_1099 [Blastocatellia bacterium]|nr:hypothetical protein [Blastocatellia bacterium]